MTNPMSVTKPLTNVAEPLGASDPAAATIVTLVAILMLPSAVFFLVGTSSMSVGVLVAAVVILAMRVMGVSGMQTLGYFGSDLVVALLIVGLLAAHLVICALAEGIDTMKAVGSLVMAAIAIAACGTAGSIFRRASDQLVKRAAAVAMAIFLMSAALSRIGIQPSSTTSTSKPIFPFTEPSLFAGALLPIIAFWSVTSRGWRRWAWILTGFALGYLLQNLSLIMGSVVVTVACLTTARLAVFGLVAALVLPMLDLSYFLDRVQFDVTATTNLSTLVYIQGWEMISAATRKTLGWGLGFQQLGYTFLDAPTSNLIYRLTGGLDLNLKEGSFAAAKLISELGVFGLVLIVAHGCLAVRAFLSLRRVTVDGEYLPLGRVLAFCSIYTYIVDMYVRGAGYFASPTMLLISSVFLIGRDRRGQDHAVQAI